VRLLCVERLRPGYDRNLLSSIAADQSPRADYSRTPLWSSGALICDDEDALSAGVMVQRPAATDNNELRTNG